MELAAALIPAAHEGNTSIRPAGGNPTLQGTVDLFGVLVREQVQSEATFSAGEPIQVPFASAAGQDAPTDSEQLTAATSGEGRTKSVLEEPLVGGSIQPIGVTGSDAVQAKDRRGSLAVAPDDRMRVSADVQVQRGNAGLESTPGIAEFDPPLSVKAKPAGAERPVEARHFPSPQIATTDALPAKQPVAVAQAAEPIETRESAPPTSGTTENLLLHPVDKGTETIRDGTAATPPERACAVPAVRNQQRNPELAVSPEPSPAKALDQPVAPIRLNHPVAKNALRAENIDHAPELRLARRAKFEAVQSETGPAEPPAAGGAVAPAGEPANPIAAIVAPSSASLPTLTATLDEGQSRSRVPAETHPFRNSPALVSRAHPLMASIGDRQAHSQPGPGTAVPQGEAAPGGMAERVPTAGTHQATQIQNATVVTAAVPVKNSDRDAIPPGPIGGAPSFPATSGDSGAPFTGSMSAPSPLAHPAARVTFERLDTAAAPQTIESSPHRLAVGVHSGGLGWVEVHTSSSAGQVSATLASASAESHHALAAQLPAVREFLAGQHVRVDTLASERFPTSSGGHGGSSGDQRNKGSGRAAPGFEEDQPMQTSSTDQEWERLSYISVRV